MNWNGPDEDGGRIDPRTVNLNLVLAIAWLAGVALIAAGAR